MKAAEWPTPRPKPVFRSTAQAAEGPILTIEKLYVKDASLEVPNAPGIFLENLQPQIDVQMGTQTQQIAEGLYESTLHGDRYREAEEKTVFLCEVAQAGIFQIRGFGEEELRCDHRHRLPDDDLPVRP